MSKLIIKKSSTETLFKRGRRLAKTVEPGERQPEECTLIVEGAVDLVKARPASDSVQNQEKQHPEKS